MIKRLMTVCAVAAFALSCAPRDRYVTLSGYAQGGTYTVKMNLKDAVVPVEEIRDSVDALLKEIDNSISGYNKGSLLSRFNAGESVAPDSIFVDVYRRSYLIYKETGGVVDVASAPLFDLWGFGFTTDSLPLAEKVTETLAVSGMDRLVEDMDGAVAADGTLSPASLLADAGDQGLLKLNYNAVAQGYSCDVIARYLYSVGIRDMMVDIGEIFCDGRNPSGEQWSLGIDRPVDGNNELGADIHGVFRAPDGPCGIVTSGNYRKFYVRDGKKYAHTIDPRTGCPVSHSLLSATVVAKDAMTADAYATYCMVVGLEEACRFLEGRKDMEGCLIYDENGCMKTWCSSGFHLEEL